MTTTDHSEFLASLPEALRMRGGDSPLDVPAAIRRDVAIAVKTGLIPSHAKFSIRRSDYKSIYVDLVEWHGGAVLVAEYVTALMDHTISGSKEQVNWGGGACRRTRRQSQDARLTNEINNAMWLVEQIADRHNYDNSDLMTDHFDVGYYLHVSASKLASAAERGLRAEIDPAFADLVRRGHDAAKRLGPKVVRSICGAQGVEGASQWSLDRLLKIDAKAAGRPLVYNKQRAYWVVATESEVRL